MITVTGDNLTIEEVVKVARNNEKVQLSKDSISRINKARDMVERLMQEDRVVYGVTTGFGKFSNVKISSSQALQLQENLVKSHSAGVGKPLPIEVVKAMMLLRANALAKGFSGIRLQTLQLLVDMLNENIVPWVPEQGSVGASGDLIPLAHMVLVMLGKGKAYVDGELVDSQQALNKKGLNPITLESKEGIALINGTQMMTALGALAVYDSINIALNADLALSGSVNNFV